MWVFRVGAFPTPTGWHTPPLAPSFFRTFLWRFRVDPPFIVWLVGVLVAKPKGEHVKKLKKLNIGLAGGRPPTLVPLWTFR